jgi:hypothetical protein
MTNPTIYAVDEVVPRPGEARAFLAAYMERYAPGARSRGMTLEHVRVSPPMWLEDQSNTLTITWAIEGVPAWWQMSMQGRSDPAIAAWWREADSMVVRRERRYMAAREDVEALSHV